MIGWVIVGLLVGAAATTILVTFWDNIKKWLTSVAANAVERVFGYKARERMFRAVAKVDRVVNVVRNRTTIYTKKDDLDIHFLKTDVVAECATYEIDPQILEEIRVKGELVQEYKYTS